MILMCFMVLSDFDVFYVFFLIGQTSNKMVETATVPGAPARVAEGFGGAAGGASAGGLGPTARGSGG